MVAIGTLAQDIQRQINLCLTIYRNQYPTSSTHTEIYYFTYSTYYIHSPASIQVRLLIYSAFFAYNGLGRTARSTKSATTASEY